MSHVTFWIGSSLRLKLETETKDEPKSEVIILFDVSDCSVIAESKVYLNSAIDFACTIYA